MSKDEQRIREERERQEQKQKQNNRRDLNSCKDEQQQRKQDKR